MAVHQGDPAEDRESEILVEEFARGVDTFDVRSRRPDFRPVGTSPRTTQGSWDADNVPEFYFDYEGVGLLLSAPLRHEHQGPMGELKRPPRGISAEPGGTNCPQIDNQQAKRGEQSHDGEQGFGLDADPLLSGKVSPPASAALRMGKILSTG